MRRLQQLHEHAHHTGRRVELSTTLPFGGGELLEEVLVDLTEQVARAAPVRAALPLRGETCRVEEVDEFAEAARRTLNGPEQRYLAAKAEALRANSAG